MAVASGSFDVTTVAEPPFLERDGIKLNRAVVRKEFSGGMAGSSEAWMTAALTGTPGSAGYVAVERFTGSVGGRTGSFVLQHSGVMAGGEAECSVRIVPGSGTGEFAGISGTLRIDDDEGEHSYVLDYELQ